MTEDIIKCPVCGGRMEKETGDLYCSKQERELHKDFKSSLFDYLSSEQAEFLCVFLKHYGNLKLLQQELNISYPYAKKKLTRIIQILGLAESNGEKTAVKADISNLSYNPESRKPSEIIKGRLWINGGQAEVQSLSGKCYGIYAADDGKSFLCDELSIVPPYEYRVFDVIVMLLLAHQGKAKKGSGRNCKLGEPGCEYTTVAGAVGKHYFGRHDGESVYDSVFVLASILDWAGIVHNRRGYIELTAEYRDLLER